MNRIQENVSINQERGEFSKAASEGTIQRVADKLRERNMEVIVVDDGDAARQLVLDRLSPDEEVHSGKSKTLEEAGILKALQEPGRYTFLRDLYMKMDRKTQAREIRKLIAAPDVMLGSVNALTEDGILVDTSATGSQLGPYAAGSGKVILVVGSQKIVPDLDMALKRIHEYVLVGRRAGTRTPGSGYHSRQDSNHRTGVDSPTDHDRVGTATDRRLITASGT